MLHPESAPDRPTESREKRNKPRKKKLIFFSVQPDRQQHYPFVTMPLLCRRTKYGRKKSRQKCNASSREETAAAAEQSIKVLEQGQSLKRTKSAGSAQKSRQ